MNEYQIDKIEVDRFSGKMYLDTFIMNLNNSFESSADNEIERLISENNSSVEKYKKLDKKSFDKHHEQEEIEKQNCLIDEVYRNEQIWALVEMKIIYAFKFLEINIKKILRTSFPKTSKNDFFKWDSLNIFLKSKNIKPHNLKGYNEILQLKDVNNTLKHSDKGIDKLKNRIPEFQKVERITFSELNFFYNRIKSYPAIYLGALADAIYIELYEFSEPKIDMMADELCKRMEKKDAYSLINAIKSKY